MKAQQGQNADVKNDPFLGSAEQDINNNLEIEEKGQGWILPCWTLDNGIRTTLSIISKVINDVKKNKLGIPGEETRLEKYSSSTDVNRWSMQNNH